MCFAGAGLFAGQARAAGTKLISPGCRKSKVKVARLYMGTKEGPLAEAEAELPGRDRAPTASSSPSSAASWPTSISRSMRSSPRPTEVDQIKDKLKDVDGILVIHLSMGTGGILKEILSVGKPTAVFAIPYSGHEWSSFGDLQKQPAGAKMECFLTSDYSQLAAAIRPFRAIHHLREAKILNVTTRSFKDYADQMKAKFGTEMKQIDLDTVVKAYNADSDDGRQGRDRAVDRRAPRR